MLQAATRRAPRWRAGAHILGFGRAAATATEAPTITSLLVSEDVFHHKADATLDHVFDRLSDLVDERLGPDADVVLESGVLTAILGAPHGTYVINKQTPNRELWLSSPVRLTQAHAHHDSGPKRYRLDLATGAWINTRDAHTLSSILEQELTDKLGVAPGFRF